jgi:ABC-2 type transport system permease protein
MINSIIQHEVRRIISSRKSWYCFAAIYMLMAIIMNWLVSNFLSHQITLNTEVYGITEEVVHPFYAWFSLIVLLFTPMLCTQAICAEKVHKTIINYYCNPVTALQVLVGKFLAMTAILILSIFAISIMPVSILLSGSLDWGQFLASVFGTFLMLSAAFAIGLGVSSFMSNVVRSNVTIFLVILAFILFEWAAQYTGHYAMFLQNFGLLNPLKNFLAGVLNLQNLAYYLLIIYSFLMLGSWRFARGAYEH